MDFYTNVAIAGDDILVVGYSGNKRIQERVKFKPYLFVPQGAIKNSDDVEDPEEYKDIYGNRLTRVPFDGIQEARDFIRKAGDQAGMIFGTTDFQYQYISETFKGRIKYDASLIRVCFLDIEIDSRRGFPNIESAPDAITTIAWRYKGKNVVFGWGKDYKPTKAHVTYIKCMDEADMLQTFVTKFREEQFDVVSGWNVEVFDIPYIYYRLLRLFNESYAKLLSPWKMVRIREVETAYGKRSAVDYIGLSVIDYIPTYKKFSYTQQESYKLDHVAFEEVGANKLHYEGTLFDLYDNDYQTYVDYNIRDTDLVEMIDQKRKLIELVFALAYDGKYNFNDAFGTVKPWDIIIYNYLIEQNIAIPPRPNNDGVERESLPGGHVKDPKIGLSEWVVSYDFSSLYPSLMQQFNISHDALFEPSFINKLIQHEKKRRGLS